MVQSLDELDIESITPLTPEIISRQATQNIGTIGHVAHGKSTLVKAISGVNVSINYFWFSLLFFYRLSDTPRKRSVTLLLNLGMLTPSSTSALNVQHQNATNHMAPRQRMLRNANIAMLLCSS